MKHIALLIPLVGTMGLHAQELSLDSAIARALRNDRIAAQQSAVVAEGELRDRDVRSSWYPQLVLNAQSTYQNEQMSFPLAVPGVKAPEVPLDLHRVLLNFNQVIYDGGAVREKRRLEALSTDRQRLEVEARAIDLKAQVIQRYLSVLVCEEQLRLLDAKAGTLNEQAERAHHAVEAGSALAAEEDALRAELVSTAQDRFTTEHLEQRLRTDLALLTGDATVKQATFTRPVVDAPLNADLSHRADLHAIDLRSELLDAQVELTRARRRPTLQAFGNAGFGNPGYNLFNPDTRPMLLAGIGLQWNIIGWGQVDRQRRIAELQRSTLSIERARIERQVLLAMDAQDADIALARKLMEEDERLIALRTSITAARNEQLTNGTATTADYITELNKETAAKLALELHRLQLINAQRTHLNLQGQ